VSEINKRMLRDALSIPPEYLKKALELHENGKSHEELRNLHDSLINNYSIGVPDYLIGSLQSYATNMKTYCRKLQNGHSVSVHLVPGSFTANYANSLNMAVRVKGLVKLGILGGNISLKCDCMVQDEHFADVTTFYEKILEMLKLEYPAQWDVVYPDIIQLVVSDTASEMDIQSYIEEVQLIRNVGLGDWVGYNILVGNLLCSHFPHKSIVSRFAVEKLKCVDTEIPFISYEDSEGVIIGKGSDIFILKETHGGNFVRTTRSDDVYKRYLFKNQLEGK